MFCVNSACSGNAIIVRSTAAMKPAADLRPPNAVNTRLVIGRDSGSSRPRTARPPAGTARQRRQVGRGAALCGPSWQQRAARGVGLWLEQLLDETAHLTPVAVSTVQSEIERTDAGGGVVLHDFDGRDAGGQCGRRAQ